LTAVEHRSVTSDGSAYVRFNRSLDNGNELLVLAAASCRASH
jgi:hypothetical protein